MRALPLHVKYTQAEGPLDAYKRATDDWTPQMQQDLKTAYGTADRRGPVILRMNYRCPECGVVPESIGFESVVFYENDDRFHMGKVVGEAQLITIEGCGHSFRRGAL